MNRRLAAIALVISLVAVCLSLVWAYARLPANVASHFNAAGNADSWMLRETHLVLMAGVGLGLPLALVGVFYSIRWLPTAIVNMPNRQYWLAPERREEAARRMLVFGLWIATLEALFMLGIHILVVEANQAQPARLSNAVWAMLAAFLAVLVVWLVALYRQFRLPRRTPGP